MIVLEQETYLKVCVPFDMVCDSHRPMVAVQKINALKSAFEYTIIPKDNVWIEKSGSGWIVWLLKNGNMRNVCD